MSMHRNGRVAAPTRRLRVVPETKPYIVDRPNEAGRPARDDLTVLRDRIALLEALLAENSIAVPAFDDADEIPETVGVEIRGYVDAETTPPVVLIEVDAARKLYHEQAWVDVMVADPETGEARSERQWQYSLLAETAFNRAMLQAVLPDLTAEEATVLGNERGPGLEILRELGWLGRQAATADAGDDDPEAAAPAVQAPTGASSSLDSAAPTPASTS